jgi:hypothetical protein
MSYYPILSTYSVDDILHVISLGRVNRDNVIHAGIIFHRGIIDLANRGRLTIRERQVVEEITESI